MKREVVRDFLNLPGIAGVALMDGRSRPYFCGVDQALNFQQKEALAQGIRQVIDTTPEDFESFEFQFTGHQVYIYKLKEGIVLLVLARASLVYEDLLRTILPLKAALEEDISKAIATFRLLASDITSTQSGWKPPGTETLSNIRFNHNGPTPTPPAPPAPSAPSDREPSSTLTGRNGKSSVSPPKHPEPDQPELKEVLAGLNHLSQFTTQFLGTAVITNYWKSSRPDVEWLKPFQIDRGAQITFTDASVKGTTVALSAQEHQWIKDWVAAFVKRCSQVIRDFPSLVEQKGLDDRQKSLLL
jgi:hypothetical protein